MVQEKAAGVRGGMRRVPKANMIERVRGGSSLPEKKQVVMMLSYTKAGRY